MSLVPSPLVIFRVSTQFFKVVSSDYGKPPGFPLWTYPFRRGYTSLDIPTSHGISVARRDGTQVGSSSDVESFKVGPYDRCKWSYNPYKLKWPYKWVTGL